MSFTRKNKYSLSTSALAASQQSQPVCPWSAHAPPFGQSPSPFLRNSHALSTSPTAAGELFLFGGYLHRSRSPSNDLYVISTRDFSKTLLQTGGDVPSPRCGHSLVLTGTILLIWGGTLDSSDQNAQNQSNDDSFYLLNLVSREWSLIVVNGPRPGGRSYHTMTLVGSKLFLFGGRIDTCEKMRYNDIWALDLNCLKSNPFWESYEPAPGNEKPLPRAGHISVTTGDRIIIFGGYDGANNLNDTWSFKISTRKWTELQCTGSIPSPRTSHAAVLIDDIMYVYGGGAIGGTILGDLFAFNLSTQRWTAFEDMGPSPCRRWAHAMASDGRRVFVIGGALSQGAQADDTKPIHVLDTKLLIYPQPNSSTFKYSKKTTHLSQKLFAGHLTQGQPQHGIFSSSDAGTAPAAFPFQTATSENMGRPASAQITRERDPSSNGLPSRPTAASSRPRRVPEEDDDGEGSTEHNAMLMTPDSPPGKEISQLEHMRLIELERQLSKTLVAKTERDRRIAQLTDELALKSGLLEQAAEDKKRAGLEQRELYAKLDELLLFRDQAEANAAEAKKRAGLKQRELQAKLDELLLSREQGLEQAQSALQKATFRAAETERSPGCDSCEHGTEVAEVHAKLETRESELAAVRLQLTDAEDGWAKSKAEADILRAQTAAGPSLVNTDVDQVVHRLVQRMRTMEAELESRRLDEKSIEEMECRNEE